MSPSSTSYDTFDPEASFQPNDNPNPTRNFRVTGAPRAAGDVDGDGHDDYLYATAAARDERTSELEDTTGKTALVLGRDTTDLTVDQIMYDHLRPVGDIDGDGHADAVAVDEMGAAQIYVGTSSGYQSSGVVVEGSLGDLVRGFSDLDADGYTDVLFARRDSPDFDVLFGAESVGDVSRVEYSSSTGADFFTYNMADLTGSGQASIVRLAGSEPKMHVQIKRVDPDTRILISKQDFTSSKLAGQADNHQLSLIDLNGNGDREIATAVQGTAYTIFESRGGQEQFDGYRTAPLRFDQVDPIPLGDLNNDGSWDLYRYAVEADKHFLSYGPDNLERGLALANEIRFGNRAVGGGGYEPTGGIGDVTGDGVDDAILDYANFSDQPYATGHWVLRGGEDQAISVDTVTHPRRSHVYDRVLSTTNLGDVNGDEIDDVAVPFFDQGRVGVYFGGATLSNDPDALLSVGPFPYVAAGGDFDGDGAQDMAVVSWGIDRETSRFDIFLGGTGFGGPVDHTVSYNQVAPPRSEGGFYYLANAGDLNGDGRADLVLSAPFTYKKETGGIVNEVFVYFGGESFSTRPDEVINYRARLGQGLLGAGYRATGIGDFNGDGTDDLAVGILNRRNENGTTGAVDLFFGEDTPSYRDPDLTIIPEAEDGSTYEGFSFGLQGGKDINGDGDSDLVVGASFFQGGDAARIYYGGTGEGKGDATADDALKAPTEAFGSRAENWEYNDDGFVDRNRGSLTLADFRQDGTADVVLNSGYAGSSQTTHALLYHGQSTEPNRRGSGRGPDAVFQAPNSTTTLGGGYGAAAGDFTGNGSIDYMPVQGRDDNDAYRSSRLYRYQPYDSTLAASSNHEGRQPETMELTVYPNPVNQQLTIEYRVPASGPVQLHLYDVLGRRVAVLADGWRKAGRHTVQVRGGRLASGVYMGRLSSEAGLQTKKIIVGR